MMIFISRSGGWLHGGCCEVLCFSYVHFSVCIFSCSKNKNEVLNTNNYQAMTEEYYFFNLKFIFY